MIARMDDNPVALNCIVQRERESAQQDAPNPGLDLGERGRIPPDSSNGSFDCAREFELQTRCLLGVPISSG